MLKISLHINTYVLFHQSSCCPLLLECESAHTDSDSGGAIHCESTKSPKQDRYSVHLLQLGFTSVYVFDMLQADVFDCTDRQQELYF